MLILDIKKKPVKKASFLCPGGKSSLTDPGYTSDTKSTTASQE